MMTGTLKGNGGYFGLQLKGIQSLMEGKGCCQEKAAAGHIVSIVRKQTALNADNSVHSFLFTWSGAQFME